MGNLSKYLSKELSMIFQAAKDDKETTANVASLAAMCVEQLELLNNQATSIRASLNEVSPPMPKQLTVNDAVQGAPQKEKLQVLKNFTKKTIDKIHAAEDTVSELKKKVEKVNNSIH